MRCHSYVEGRDEPWLGNHRYSGIENALLLMKLVWSGMKIHNMAENHQRSKLKNAERTNLPIGEVELAPKGVSRNYSMSILSRLWYSLY